MWSQVFKNILYILFIAKICTYEKYSSKIEIIYLN